jgi:outer membrane immunogenic protein
MKTLLLTAVSAITATGAAHAQQPAQSGQFHLGAGYQFIDAEAMSIDALTVRGGYDINPFFGVEADLLVGLGDETLETVGGESITGGLDYGLGLYLKGQYPVAPEFSVFARVGYVYADAELSAAGMTLSEDVDGWAFGLGAEWAFAGPNAVRFDYTRYEFTHSNGDADAFGVSYVRRF